MTANYTIRLDTDLRKEAEELFNSLGLNLSTAMNIFLRKAIETDGFPFDVRRQPRPDILEAMEEAKRIARDPTVKRYSDINEIRAELER